MVRILNPRIVHSCHHLVRQAAEMPTSDIARKHREAVAGTATTSSKSQLYPSQVYARKINAG